MSRVFIPQEPTRLIDGVPTRFMNFMKAAEYGDPVVLMPSGPISLSPVPTMAVLREKLADFSDDDYIIGVGDTALMMMVAAVAADVNRGRFRLLKHDKGTGSYIKVEVDIHKRPGQI